MKKLLMQTVLLVGLVLRGFNKGMNLRYLLVILHPCSPQALLYSIPWMSKPQSLRVFPTLAL